MYDSVLYNIQKAEMSSQVFDDLKLKPKTYALATLHRAENTDDPKKLRSIFQAFARLSRNGQHLVIPLHPRTRERIDALEPPLQGLKLVPPLPYLDMLLLEKEATVILTDSGGVQKEAYWFQVPCVTLREETEWMETVESGWNVLAGSDLDRILAAVQKTPPGRGSPDKFGDGQAAEKIVNIFSSM